MSENTKEETLQKIHRGEPAVEFEFDQSLDVKFDEAGNLFLDCAAFPVQGENVAAIMRIAIPQEAVGILRTAIKHYESRFAGALDSGVPGKH